MPATQSKGGSAQAGVRHDTYLPFARSALARAYRFLLQAGGQPAAAPSNLEGICLACHYTHTSQSPGRTRLTPLKGSDREILPRICSALLLLMASLVEPSGTVSCIEPGAIQPAADAL